jgi:hypothetical protein
LRLVVFAFVEFDFGDVDVIAQPNRHIGLAVVTQVFGDNAGVNAGEPSVCLQ